MRVIRITFWLPALIALMMVPGYGDDIMTHDETDRTIELEETVNGSLDAVWHAWTTREGVTTWLVQDADVKLEIGGPYEFYFAPNEPEGTRGSEECTILSFKPMTMLSFSWNAPPSIPELRKLGACTWVVLEFEPVSDSQTRVKFTQFGIKQGEAWDQYLAYFQQAWPSVLGALKKHFDSVN